MSVIENWIDALQTTNLPEDAQLDPVSKWLIISRASVFPMTLFAGAIGGLLAATHATFDPWLWVVSLVGLLLAHAANNLLNDYFDTESGVDTPDYARAQYAPHPLLSGLVSRSELLAAIVLVNVFGLLIAVYLTSVRGPGALAFALAGFAISYYYVAPPLRLKHRGLGEPSVFVIWGPLMIAGSFFISSGTLPSWVWLASVPYGLLVTAVLFGKHIDKIDADSAKRIRTLPVILGRSRARTVTQGLIVAFYASTAFLVVIGVLSPFTLLVFASYPRLRRVWKVIGEPVPETPPRNYPMWPLWYVAAAFVLVRQAGALLVAGLLIDLVWGAVVG